MHNTIYLDKCVMYKNKHTDTYCTGNGRKMTTAETVQEIVKWLGSTRI